MNKITFSLSGVENLHRIFRDFPEKGLRKPLIKAFRKAAYPIGKRMIQNLPSKLRFLKSSFRIVPQNKEPGLLIGFFRKKSTHTSRQGKVMDNFQLAYWANYGTLSNRFSGHSF